MTTTNEALRDQIKALSDQFTAHTAQTARDRDMLAKAIGGLSNTVQGLSDHLGEEPDTEGHGGSGLTADVRKLSRDLRTIIDLRNKGLGAVGAVVVFGALIILGVTRWVENIANTVARAAS